MEQLINIQNELKAGKDNYSKFGKYSYRSCESILEALKPLLKEHQGILNITDEIVMVGTRVYLKATVKVSFICEGELYKSEESTGWAREVEQKKGMDAAQITGAASSYARKYALCGLFLIDDGVDADGQDNTAEPEQPSFPETPPPQKPVDTRDPEEETNKFFKGLPERKDKLESITRIKNWINNREYVDKAHYDHVLKNFNDKEKEFWHQQEAEGK